MPKFLNTLLGVIRFRCLSTIRRLNNTSKNGIVVSPKLKNKIESKIYTPKNLFQGQTVNWHFLLKST